MSLKKILKVVFNSLLVISFVLRIKARKLEGYEA